MGDARRGLRYGRGLNAIGGTAGIVEGCKPYSIKEDVMREIEAYRLIGSILASVSLSALLVSFATSVVA
jgi:hypothetical protein